MDFSPVYEAAGRLGKGKCACKQFGGSVDAGSALPYDSVP